MSEILVAAVSVASVVVGAVLQFRLSRSGERLKRLDSLRARSYADYLRSVAMAAHCIIDDDLRKACRLSADAKSRMAVYADRPVLRAMAEFERAGSTLNNDSSWDAFTAVVEAMRGPVEGVDADTIQLLLRGRKSGPVAAAK